MDDSSHVTQCDCFSCASSTPPTYTLIHFRSLNLKVSSTVVTRSGDETREATAYRPLAAVLSSSRTPPPTRAGLLRPRRRLSTTPCTPRPACRPRSPQAAPRATCTSSQAVATRGHPLPSLPPPPLLPRPLEPVGCRCGRPGRPSTNASTAGLASTPRPSTPIGLHCWACPG